MFITFLVILGLALLIIGHEAGHFFAARFFGMKVDEFGFGFPPRIFAKKRGDTEYSFNWLPFGGFVKIAGENDRVYGDFSEFEKLPDADRNRYFFAQPAWNRSVVILAGVVINFLIGWLLLSLIFAIGTPQNLVISDIQKDSPAEAAGFKPGDVVLGYETAKSFTDYTKSQRGNEIVVTIRRGQEELSLKAKLRGELEEGQGALGVFLAEAGIPQAKPHLAFWYGLKAAWDMAVMTIVSFGELVKNIVLHGRLLEGVVGPVGIVGVAQDAGRVGLIYLLQLLALISINLSVINLLPLPALDGGRFVMILYEKIKGRPISRAVEGWVNGLGFLALLLLMAVITIRDVAQWF